MTEDEIKALGTGAALVRAALDTSGLSQEMFARVLTWRDSRTVRYWLVGEVVPETVVSRLRWFLALPPTVQRRLLMIVTGAARR